MCKPQGRSWKRNKRPGILVLHFCLDIVKAAVPVQKQQTSQVLHLLCFTYPCILQLGHSSIPGVYTDQWCCHSICAQCEQTSCWCMACMTKCHPPYHSLRVSKDTYFWQNCPVSSVIQVLIKCTTLMETYLIVASLSLDNWTPRMIL